MAEELERSEAQRLTDEAKSLWPSVDLFVLIMRRIHDSEAYRALGYDTWERYLLDEFDRSLSAGRRWLAQAKELEATAPGSDKGAGQTTPRANISTPPTAQTGSVSQREAARRTRTEKDPPARSPKPSPKPAPVIDATAREKPEPVQQSLFAFLDEDPKKAAQTLGVDERLKMARRLRRWADRFEEAAKGVAAYDRPAGTDARPVRHFEEASKDCRHPVNVRIGDECAACGATVKGAGR